MAMDMTGLIKKFLNVTEPSKKSSFDLEEKAI
jgi:hypothetical protein